MQRFTPLLLQTVGKYDAAFEGKLDGAGEAALERVAELCADTSATKGRTLRQLQPSAKPNNS